MRNCPENAGGGTVTLFWFLHPSSFIVWEISRTLFSYLSIQSSLVQFSSDGEIVTTPNPIFGFLSGKLMSSLFQVCGRKQLFNLPRGCICMLLRVDGGEPSVGHASGCELYCTPENYTQKNSTASERSGGCLWETGRRKRRSKWRTGKAGRRKLWCRQCQPGAEHLHRSPWWYS